MGRVAGITAAVGLHLGFLLFGGLLIPGASPAHATTREVDLLDDRPRAKAAEPEPEATPPPEAQPEQAPDVERALQAMAADANDAPELSALSLGAIEQALAGVSGGADFGLGGSLQSGGRIGGTGSGGAAVAGLDDAFSLAEIDQRPRPLFQAQPAYP